MRERLLRHYLVRAVEDGLLGAAFVDKNGEVLAAHGAIDQDEAMPLAALVMYRMKSPDLAQRLFAGEVLSLSLSLDDREVAVAIAKRQLFVVAVLVALVPEQLELVALLRDFVGGTLADPVDGSTALPPPTGGNRRLGLRSRRARARRIRNHRQPAPSQGVGYT